MFFDMCNSYNCLNIRSYKFDSDDYSYRGDISLGYYNNFLMFTSTVYPKETPTEFGSILLFFSYPNGTDFEIDIGKYIMDSGFYEEGKNLVNFLLSKCVIDNNIFNYSLLDEIKLVSIPDEIIFYKKDNNTPLVNGEKINSEFYLKQNKSIIKYSHNYHLYYQFLAKDFPTYNDLYQNSHSNHKDDSPSCDLNQTINKKLIMEELIN